MNPQTQTSEPSNAKAAKLAAEAEQLRIDVNEEEAGKLATVSTDYSDQTQVGEILDRVRATLAELPTYVSSFFYEYQRPILTVGTIFAALVTVRVVLAVVDAVNDIPLLSPFFELIGMGYSGWFVYRYLLRASNRKELVKDISSLKEQVLGNQSSEG